MAKRAKPRGFKKKAAAVVACVLALCTAFGGTLAWRDYSQHKTNLASAKMPRYDVKLVENFQEKEDWKTSDGELTKEISVKNTGIEAKGYEEIYVRIQLKEYMDFSPMEIEKTPDRYMIDTDGAFIYFADEASARAAYPDAPYDKIPGGYKEITDAVSGITGWFIPTKEHDDNGQYGAFIVTKYELGDRQFLIGTEAMQDAYKEANKTQNHDVKPNKECEYPIHFWDGVDLSQDVLAQDGTNATYKASDYIKWILNSDTVTLADGTTEVNVVMTLTEWTAAGEPSGPFWIIDDRAGTTPENAWIYWGEALLPGVETADFLEAIELISQPDGDFNYRIHTELEAVSLPELFDTDPAWPGMPGDLKDSLQENAPQVIIDLAPLANPITIKRGETFTPTGITVKPDSASQTVTHTSGNPGIASVDPDTGTVTGLLEGKTVVTVTAENGKKASYTVIVKGATKYQELQDALKKAQAIVDDQTDGTPVYTDDSWTNANLPGAIAAGQMSTPETEDYLLQNLIDLLNNAMSTPPLVPVSNVDDQLQAALDEAEALLDLPRSPGSDHSGTGNGDANIYKPDWLDDLQEAYEDAKEILEDPDSTPQKKQDALEALQDILDEKETDTALKADKDGLKDLLQEASELFEADYTTYSWDDFEAARDNAQDVANDPNASAQDIQDAIDDLHDAMYGTDDVLNNGDGGLVERGDTSDLTDLIAAGDAAKGSPADYSGEEGLEPELQNAKDAVADNSNLSQDDIDTIEQALQGKLDVLRYIKDLVDANAAAESLEPTDYSNWVTVMGDGTSTGLLYDASQILANPGNYTQLQIDNAASALLNAIPNLTAVDKAGALTAALTGHPKTQTVYTTSSWADTSSSGGKTYIATYNDTVAMLDAINSDSSAYTIEQVNAQIAKLNDAASLLVLRGDPTAINALANNWKSGVSPYDNHYTPYSWNALQDEITNNSGNGSLDVSDLTQGQVDAKKTALEGKVSALVDIAALVTAHNSAIAHQAYTESGTGWTNYGAFSTALTAASTIINNAATNYTATQISDAVTALTNAQAALKKVTGFTVAASGAKVQTATSSNFTLGLVKSGSEQTITLTGAVTGIHTADLTTWTPGGAQSAWGAATGDSKTYTVTVLANATGTMTVVAKAKDGTQTLTITINVTAVTAFKVEYPSYASSDFYEVTQNQAFDHEDTSVDRYFRGTVTGGSGTNNTVNWAVDSTADTAGVTITAQTTTNGYATLHFPTAYSGTVTVTASAADDSSFSRTFTVEVDPTVPTISTGNNATRQLAAAVTGDTGAAWHEIATVNIAGTDYSLITRGAVLPATTSYTATHAFGSNNNYAGSNVQGHINEWYTTFTTNNGSSPLVTKAVGNNVLDRLGSTFAWVGDGFSKPVAGSITPGAADTAFALSSGEAKLFVSRYYYNTTASGQVDDGTSTQKYLNWNALSGKGSIAWLRSPGRTATYASTLGNNGGVGNVTLPNTYSVRPALWVTSDIFNP